MSQMRARGADVIRESGPSAIPSARVAPGPGTGSRPRAGSPSRTSPTGACTVAWRFSESHRRLKKGSAASRMES